MDETALTDLVKKVRNVCRDFEHEHAANGLDVHLLVGVQDGSIHITALQNGGIVDLSVLASDPIQTMSNQAREGLIYDAQQQHGRLIQGPESVYPSDDPLPLLDEHSADTDEMTVPPDLLTKGASLPVENLLTDRERVDYQARRGKKETLRDGPDYTLPKKIDPNTSTI